MTAEEITNKMLEQDEFTRWMALKIDRVEAGYCKLHYQVKKEMLNGFGSIHGGVVFSASDSALAFAANSHGRIAVALDVSITYTRPAKIGDVLEVEAKELHFGNKIALYDIRTTNKNGELIAQFKGSVYRTEKVIAQYNHL